MSLADDLAAEFVTRISRITTAAGFQTNIGQRVFEGRRRLDEGHAPCAVLVEGEDSPAGQQLGKVKNVIRYAVEGIAACDPDHPNVVGRAIVADLKKAIWGTDATLGRRALVLEYLGRTIAPREDGQSLVSAAVEFAVTVVEPVGE